METIAVIMPAYNVEKTIERAIRSLVCQKGAGELFEHQIVVVNDGSTDSTWDILVHLSKEIHNLIVLTQENAGPSEARYKGIKESSSDYLAFLDSDDWAEPDYLETLFTLKKKHNADIAYCKAIMEGIDIQYNREEELILSKHEAISLFIEHRKLNGVLWGKLIRRDFFMKATPNHEMVCFEDDLLIWQLLQHCTKVVKQNVGLVHYTYDNTSLTRSAFSLKKWYSIRTISLRIIGDCKTDELRQHFPEAEKFQRRLYYMALIQMIKSDCLDDAATDEIVSVLRKNWRLTLKEQTEVARKVFALMIMLCPKLSVWIMRFASRK